MEIVEGYWCQTVDSKPYKDLGPGGTGRLQIERNRSVRCPDGNEQAVFVKYNRPASNCESKKIGGAAMYPLLLLRGEA